LEDGVGGHIRFLKFNFASILLALFTSAVAIFASGCWMMAAQLAPVAISAAEKSLGIVHLTAGVATAVTMEKHKDEDAARWKLTCTKISLIPQMSATSSRPRFPA